MPWQYIATVGRSSLFSITPVLNTLGIGSDLDVKSVLYLRREVAHAFVVSHSVLKITLQMIAAYVQKF